MIGIVWDFGLRRLKNRGERMVLGKLGVRFGLQFADPLQAPLTRLLEALARGAIAIEPERNPARKLLHDVRGFGRWRHRPGHWIVKEAMMQGTWTRWRRGRFEDRGRCFYELLVDINDLLIQAVELSRQRSEFRSQSGHSEIDV
jgi:hypothetical protein